LARKSKTLAYNSKLNTRIRPRGERRQLRLRFRRDRIPTSCGRIAANIAMLPELLAGANCDAHATRMIFVQFERQEQAGR
jgi:hypothetical protein